MSYEMTKRSNHSTQFVLSALIVAVATLLWATGCDKSEENAGEQAATAAEETQETEAPPTTEETAAEGETETENEPETEQTEAADESANEGAAREPVEVSATGTRFDPPVHADQIPTGAWMCDMSSSVHYAAMEQGDGRCPVCRMRLVEKAGMAEDAAAEPGHEGHQHE